MIKPSTQHLLDTLRDLLNGMDVPEFRKEDPKWLKRNLAVRNAEHPNYNKAQELISKLVQMGL